MTISFIKVSRSWLTLGYEYFRGDGGGDGGGNVTRLGRGRGLQQAEQGQQAQQQL
jgi:hypothetical protein